MFDSFKLLGIAAALTFGVAGCDVDVKDEGELPEVEVEEGRMPEVDVEGPDVDVGTETQEVEVPDIDVDTETKEIEVPDIDVDLPDDND